MRKRICSGQALAAGVAAMWFATSCAADLETDLLLPPGTTDGRFPALSAPRADLPVRLLAPLLAALRTGDQLTLPDGRYTDCAVITAGQLVLIAQHAGQVIFDGGACEGKATLVARGGALTIDGIVFRNIRVDDGNGAGIRQERGTLLVRNSVFYNAQAGILAGSGADMETRVINSRFVRVGSCAAPGGCAHGIYVGAIRLLEVQASQFLLSSGGHMLKSRAARVMIMTSVFDDRSGVASYLVDLPNGASGWIAGNLFHKGRAARNPLCMIRVGAEGATQSSAQLAITGNTARSDLLATVFIYNDSADAPLVSSNRLAQRIMVSRGRVR